MRIPFVYLTAALVVGILFDGAVELSPWIVGPVAFMVTAYAVRCVQARRGRAASGAILLATASAGGLLGFAERIDADGARLKRLFAEKAITADDAVKLTGTLIAPPEPAPGVFYLELDAESLFLCEQEIRATGKVRLMVPVEDAQSRLEFDRLGLGYAARVRALVRLQSARSYSNPGSPDFNEFLERAGFDLTGIIKSPLLIERIERARAAPLLGWLYGARLRVMDALDAQFETEVAGTLKAMLMGNRYFLSPDSAERLRESSTYHIISISGMHVGLIAWAMLGGWPTTGRRRRPHVLAVLIALWLYALVVGLQPPVTRATVMISVGLIGPMIFRRAASLNTLALAAFLMLALNPALVTDPGFQLSFVAVAAIVALAVPLAERLRDIGEWRPSARTPHPPSCPHSLRVLAECLFWNERIFRRDMRRGRVRFNLDKTPPVGSPAARLVQPPLKWLGMLIITSTAIQLVTLPLGVLYFNRIVPMGILVNVASGLLTAAMMLGGVAALLLSAISPWAAEQIEAVVSVSHYLLVHAGEPLTALPGATFRAPHSQSWIIYVLYFAMLVAVMILVGRWRPVYIVEPGAEEQGLRTGLKREAGHAISPAAGAIICGAGVVLCLAAIARPAAPAADGELVIHFLDVGQGDSALIVFPEGATMLVDAGGEIIHTKEGAGPGGGEARPGHSMTRSFIGEMVVSRFLWSLGLTRLDYALVTHADRDHIGGFSEVVRNFHIGQAVVGDVPVDNIEFNRFADLLFDRGIPAARVSAGQRFEIQGVKVDVLWPPAASQAQAISSNDRSIVIRLVYGSVAVLMAGDIEREAEEALVRSGNTIRADLLKVPHHGSKTSSGEAFLDAVRPRSAIISVGERSRFGHPHDVVVDRYLERGIMLYHTGRDGTISVRTDGASLRTSTYRR